MRGYNIRWRHGANPSIANDPRNSGPPAKTEYDFGKNQQWVKTARSLTFLDETPELMSIYDHDYTPDETHSQAPFQWPDLNDSRVAIVAASTQQPSPASLPSPAQQPLPAQFNTPGSLPALVHRSTPGRQSGLETLPLPGSSPAQGLEIVRTQSRRPADFQSTAKRRRLTFESTFRGFATPESPAQLSNASPNVDSWHTGWTPNDAIDNITTNDTTGSSEFDLSGYAGLETTVSQSLSRIYLETPCWPLRVSCLHTHRCEGRSETERQQDYEEAKLLKHYVENLSRNFDLTDPLNHFRSVVPQRAATCPTLMVRSILPL